MSGGRLPRLHHRVLRTNYACSTHKHQFITSCSYLFKDGYVGCSTLSGCGRAMVPCHLVQSLPCLWTLFAYTIFTFFWFLWHYLLIILYHWKVKGYSDLLNICTAYLCECSNTSTGALVTWSIILNLFDYKYNNIKGTLFLTNGHGVESCCYAATKHQTICYNSTTRSPAQTLRM